MQASNTHTHPKQIIHIREEMQGRSNNSIPGAATFKRLVVRDTANWVEVVVREGDQEKLELSGPEAMLRRMQWWVKDETLFVILEGSLWDKIKDALTTSLTRKTVRIAVEAIELEAIDVFGMVQVDTSAITGDPPKIRLRGPAALWGSWRPTVRR
jgi:hypothetical protein